jgi:fatty-acid desaturase
MDHHHAPAVHGGPKLRFRDLDPISVIAIGGMHVGAIAAPFYFTWGALGSAVFLWWLTGAVGICLCYHRLLTHRSFKTWKWVEYAMAFVACAAWQGGPLEWVGTHRLHHRHAEDEEDPHSPRHGFNWAHVLWCLKKGTPGHDPRFAAGDLAKDPVHRFLDKYHGWAQLPFGIALYAIGGLPWLLWGMCFRVVFTYHATWFVNSAAHTWGYRNFDTDDDSRNNWWVALLSFGEGWHNNHHAIQRSAKHGMRWWEIDVTYITIRAMSLVGLAWDVVRPAADKLGGMHLHRKAA